MNQAIASGIINLDDVRIKLDMATNVEILNAHNKAKWQGKDGKWYTHVYDSTKKDNRRLLKRKTEEALNTAIIKIVKNQLAKKKKKKDKEKITLEIIYPDWLAYKSLHTEKTSSIKRYSTEWKRYYMSDPIIKKPLDELSVLMLDEWAHRMIKQHKMNKKQYYTMSIILRQSLQYAKNRGDISENPFEAVKIESKMFRKTKKKADETQVYLEEEQALIIQEAWKDYNSSNAKETTPLAVILAFYLGCRPGETVAIREEDIRGQYIHIQRMEIGEFETTDGINYIKTGVDVAEHTKTDAGDREVYATSEAMELIRMIKFANQKQGCSGEYLFMQDGERTKETAVAWRLEKYCNHIAIPYKSPHKMRKTYISTLIDNNLNINTIRKLVGHEDEKTTYQSYCFDRRNNTQIETQLEEALKFNNEKSNIITFVNPCNMDQVTIGNQNQI